MASTLFSSTTLLLPSRCDWASLFGVTEANQLHYVEPTLVDGILQIIREICDDGTKHSQHYLVGQVLDSPSALPVVQGWEKKLWGRKEPITFSRFGARG
ncbi:hypothetical protein LINPERHAP2_LOCUS11690 [Linum perenne]